jgi:hypothetical protein
LKAVEFVAGESGIYNFEKEELLTHEATVILSDKGPVVVW